jgi:hypothetical protein
VRILLLLGANKEDFKWVRAHDKVIFEKQQQQKCLISKQV